MNRKYKCIVVANGLFPVRPELLALLREADFVLACDGAVVKLEAYRQPDIIVGDLDSLTDEVRQRYAGRILHIAEQETNDLTKAVHYARDKGFSELLILGATGLREDHTLGNISLLLEYVSDFRRVEMMSDFGCFTPLTVTSVLDSYPGQQVSFFSLYPHGAISVRGLRYPIEKRRLYSWWEATLNESLGYEFSVILHEEARLLVYRQFAPQIQGETSA